jgi:hypothetical protein
MSGNKLPTATGIRTPKVGEPKVKPVNNPIAKCVVPFINAPSSQETNDYPLFWVVYLLDGMRVSKEFRKNQLKGAHLFATAKIWYN